MAWEFEHSVEARADPARAWAFWTDLGNWKLDPAVEWAIPELVRELKIEDMDIPITNKR